MSQEESADTPQKRTPRSMPIPLRSSRISAHKVLWAAAGLMLGILVQPVAAYGAQAVNSFITNDAAHPVPVTGSVNVGNLPATTTVEVANTDPIPVTQATVPTEQVAVTKNFQATSAGCTGFLTADEVLYTVPAGKQLVVDHVSVSLQILSNGDHRVWLAIGNVRHFIPNGPPQFDFSGSSSLGIGFALGADDPNVTVEGGQDVRIGMTQHWNNGSANTCAIGHQATLVGHLVG